MNLPEYLLSTHKMLTCAFPAGIETQDYAALLVILSERMSHRNIAHVVSVFVDEEYAIVLNDFYGALSRAAPAHTIIEQVNDRLLACGYAMLVDEE